MSLGHSIFGSVVQAGQVGNAETTIRSMMGDLNKRMGVVR